MLTLYNFKGWCFGECPNVAVVYAGSDEYYCDEWCYMIGEITGETLYN